MADRGLVTLVREGRKTRVQPTHELIAGFSRIAHAADDIFSRNGFHFRPTGQRYYVLYSNREGRYVEARHTEEFIGWTREDIVGQEIGFMTPPTIRRRFFADGYQRWIDRLASGNLMVEISEHLHKITGKRVVSERHATAERDRDGIDIFRSEFRLITPAKATEI